MPGRWPASKIRVSLDWICWSGGGATVDVSRAQLILGTETVALQAAGADNPSTGGATTFTSTAQRATTQPTREELLPAGQRPTATVRSATSREELSPHQQQPRALTARFREHHLHTCCRRPRGAAARSKGSSRRHRPLSHRWVPQVHLSEPPQRLLAGGADARGTPKDHLLRQQGALAVLNAPV